MPQQVTISILGETQLDRTLEGIETRVEDMSPAFSALRDRFLTIERRQFATQGSYSGGWPALSPKYRAWKATRYPGKTILRRTDDLWRSLTEGPEVLVIGRDSLVMGTAVKYAGFHQQPAGLYGGGPLPRRPPVEINEAERTEWVKVLQSYAVTGKITGVRAVS